jgi:hypothetical protein
VAALPACKNLVKPNARAGAIPMDEFKWIGLLWRLLFAVALVYATFNPTGQSYYHWLADGFPKVLPLEAA